MTKKNFITGIAVVIALAVVGIFFFIFNNPFGSMSLSSDMSSTTPDESATQLVVQDETVGTGAIAQVGDTITVDYTGKLEDGTVFDTSVGKTPYTFVLGAGNVIPGWDQGLQGMKVGGKRLLIIPPSLGYGSQDYGPIPGNSTLIFEVSLLKDTPQAAQQ
ncbi:MAG TPA: FKBP-type peptidyl-prolyl cis-trans isomerase [Candidatus Paceibacterota bacterium]|nr:FKBP-type peptidyl-prolyl cis-trans isomerase [Candidatus Paceibacterota bacterium]